MSGGHFFGTFTSTMCECAAGLPSLRTPSLTRCARQHRGAFSLRKSPYAFGSGLFTPFLIHSIRVCRGASVILNTPSILNLKNLNIEQLIIQPVRQVIGLLVTVSCTPHGASTSVLSTPYSPGGLSRSLSWTSHLKVGFTLRCLQRLSLLDLAILPWDWFPTGPPVIRPSRSSRTKDSSLQMSYACAG